VKIKTDFFLSYMLPTVESSSNDPEKTRLHAKVYVNKC